MRESLKDQLANIHNQVPQEVEAPLGTIERQQEETNQEGTSVSGHEVHDRSGRTTSPESSSVIIDMAERTGRVVPEQVVQQNEWRAEDNDIEIKMIANGDVLKEKLDEIEALLDQKSGESADVVRKVVAFRKELEAIQEASRLLTESEEGKMQEDTEEELTEAYMVGRRHCLQELQVKLQMTGELLEEVQAVLGDDSKKTGEAGGGKAEEPQKNKHDKKKRRKGGSGDGGDGGDDDPSVGGSSLKDRSKAVLLQAKRMAIPTPPEETNGDNAAEALTETGSLSARDYSEEDILEIWDHLPETPEGVVEKIAIIREQIERTKVLTQEIRELGSDERLTNQLFEEIQVPVQVVKKREGQSEQEAFMERKSSIQHLTWPDKLAGIEARLEEMEGRLQAGELTNRDVATLRTKHLDFHRLLSALEKIVDETRVEREQETPLVAAEQAARKEKKSPERESEQEEYRLFGEKLRALDEKLNEWIQARRVLLTQLGDRDYARIFVRNLPQDLKTLIKKEVMQEVVDRMEDYKKAFQEGHIPGKREWNWVGKHLDGLEAVIGQAGVLQQKIEQGEFAREPALDSTSSPETVNDSDNKQLLEDDPSSPATLSVPEVIPTSSSEPVVAKPKDTSSVEKANTTFQDLENGLLSLKQSNKELWYRAKTGEIFIVRPTRNQDVFELWQPGDLMSRHHYRELASLLYAKNVTFAGKKKQPENMSSSLKGEQREGRKELERILQEKLQIFAERMDASLRAEEPTLSFAKRRGRILAQLPEFAEKVIERFGKEALLSSDEQEAMIEAHTLSIKISK